MRVFLDTNFSENTELTFIGINNKDEILILSSALNGNAELFVTGDKELLELGTILTFNIPYIIIKM